MGYERKRGKLAELNSLLRGSGTDRFSLVVGETAVLSRVKYVITLDTDTQLPRDSARQFVAVMAHPLNRARFDTDGRRKGSDLVTEGYGILQPRVGISVPGANRSRYARMHAGDAGLDPYTRAVSDVYQDVFGEGSFIGKGIYDVDAFERSQNARFPENRILSHDLLEGCYARSGLLSDVQLYEEHPSTYAADISRRHRWIRGDWQLFGWLLPLVPGPGKRRLRNPLSALSLWKLFDNLRRSLVPPALTLLLLLGWIVLPGAWLWTLVVIAILLLPWGCAYLVDLVAEAGRRAAAAAPGLHRKYCRRPRCSIGADARIPSLRGNGQPRCDFTNRVADADYASTASRVEPVGNRRTRSSRCRRHTATLRACSVGEVDVDRPGHRRGRSDSRGVIRSVRVAACRTDTCPVVRLAGYRMVDQPAARPWRSATDSRPDALPPESRAKDMGVLRDLRRSGRQLAPAGQLPGASGRQRRASHVADEHGTCAARESDRLRLRLHPGRTTPPAHGEFAGHDDGHGAVRGAFLQLVRHAIPGAVAASLRLGSGQREPRRPSHHLAVGAPRACR